MANEVVIEKLLRTWGKEYKKGFLGYFILLFLKERSMYGFELSKKMAEISQGQILFQESGIYQLLKKLSSKGIVSSEWQESALGPRRKYYILEPSGEELLLAFTQKYILPILHTANKLVEKHFAEL